LQEWVQPKVSQFNILLLLVVQVVVRISVVVVVQVVIAHLSLVKHLVKTQVPKHH
jgi:hypothetical protein